MKMRQPKWAQAERVERTATFSLPASAERVFPLLCPVREYEWIPGWSCEMLHSRSGFAEKGAVFTTKARPFGTMLWTCTAYDPPRRIEYLRTLGSGISILLVLELAASASGCDVTWAVKATIRQSLAGAMIRKTMTESAFRSMIAAMKSRLTEYCSVMQYSP